MSMENIRKMASFRKQIYIKVVVLLFEAVNTSDVMA
jgi:hypothetical protein